MESIGQQLKAGRERRQMTIADVAAATKMTPAVVAALEADNFSVLAAPVYARGFIKLYAECVGLDSFALLKRPGEFGASGLRLPPPAVVLSPAPVTPAQARPGKAAVAASGRPALRSPAQPDEEGPELGQPACNAMRSIAGREKPKPAPKAATDRARRPSSGFSGLSSVLRRPLSVLPSGFSGLSSVLRRPLSVLLSGFSGLSSVLRRPLSVLTFRLPTGLIRRAQFSAEVWRRFLIVAGVVLLIVASALAWGWSNRRVPTLTDESRWVAEPPEPYLDMEARPAPSMKTPTRPP